MDTEQVCQFKETFLQSNLCFGHKQYFNKSDFCIWIENNRKTNFTSAVNILSASILKMIYLKDSNILSFFISSSKTISSWFVYVYHYRLYWDVLDVNIES